ncbi:MAG: hypothetical protein JXA87_08650 [Thermoleophilia bacterium]|nr:hypothetical protein [Thermoleophilia bacterium]
MTQDDTWVYDPVAGTWSMASAVTPDGPEGRVDHAMVHDRTTRSMIMFGGRSAPGSSADIPNATWEYRP